MSENQMNSNMNDLKVEFFDNSNNTKLTEISLAANAWITQKTKESIEVITEYGLGNWTSNETIVSLYFHIKNGIKIRLFVKCKVPEGKSELQFTLGDSSRLVQVVGNYYQWFSVGKFKIIGSGYIKLDIRGVRKSGPYFGDVSHLMFVHKYDQNYSFIRQINSLHTYWSRRGPSVHLSYKSEMNENHEYYYNQLLVPKGFDPIGSFFMAIGFNHGYFGIQVNSENERRVLFSVWSPQETDDPDKLLDENQVELICKNDNTEHNVFGCEGCGGQAFLKYIWETGITYKFVVRGRPDPICSSNYSIYTAWFAPKSDNTWKLIASFRRPKCRQYLKGFHSFIENFDKNMGFMTRKAYFGNQWICNSSGVWLEVDRAKFTGDSTAQNKVRLDFEGGVETSEDLSEKFYLRNGGFFEGKTQLFTEFKRKKNGNVPQIESIKQLS